MAKERVDNELEKCKKRVAQKVGALIPFFANACIGDFSKNIPIPKKIDEFTELYVGVQMMIEIAREKISILEENIAILEKKNKLSDILVVRADSRFVNINQAEILFIRALADYITIYTKTEKLTLHGTLKGVLTKLAEHEFYRIHHSYIVRVDKIKRIEGRYVIVENHSLPISRSKIGDFLKFYKGKHL